MRLAAWLWYNACVVRETVWIMTITRSRNNIWLNTSRVVMLCFLWMVTGGMVHNHHDTLISVNGHGSSAALRSLSTADAPEGPCAACEWSQAIAGEATAVSAISFPSQPHWVTPQPLFSLIHTRIPSRRMLRAPPA